MQGSSPQWGAARAPSTAPAAINALMVLGCQSSEAAKLVAKLDATLPTEEIIRLALIEMAKGM